MRKVITAIVVSIIGLGFYSCAQEKAENILTLEAGAPQQKMEGFGASDAWSCQFVGKNWPEKKKVQMADWLFSQELDEKGSPKGIGLSMWRFNIGGGSAEQGKESGIKKIWRRAESFMNDDKSFKPNSQLGQRWFLKAAKERGVSQFIGFVNSPPVQLTKNGKAFSGDKHHFNLPEENYTAYAEYLAQVTEHIKKEEGIDFKYISPINEPQWDWIDGGQEGTPVQNTEVAALVKAIDKVFQGKNIASKLELPESAQLNYIYEKGNRPNRAKQLYEFFDTASVNYIGDLPTVAHKLAGHSYYTTWPVERLCEVREKVKEAFDKNGKVGFSMSEYCLLEKNKEVKGGGRDLSMAPALYMARVMFADLVLANSSSWQWWIAISPYKYKDGLVYMDKDTTDGNIYDSKLLWTLGNFSRFVRPDMKRIDVDRSDKQTATESIKNGFMATAFASDNKEKLSVVMINYTDSARQVAFGDKLSKIKELDVYLTNDEEQNDLLHVGSHEIKETFSVPARSVVTLSNVR